MKEPLFVPYREKTVTKFVDVVIDGKPEKVRQTFTASQLKKNQLDHHLINAGSVIQSGQFIQGDVDLNPSDPQTLDTIGSDGIENILQGSGLVDVNGNPNFD